MSAVIVLERPFATLRVFPEARVVETVFPSGHRVTGTREETQANRDEAADQGYTGPDACWRSLLDHELLHVLVAEWLGWGMSIALSHEAGVRRVPYGQRLYEEALVIAFQRWQQTGDVWPALEPFHGRLAFWALAFQRVRDQVPV